MAATIRNFARVINGDGSLTKEEGKEEGRDNDRTSLPSLVEKPEWEERSKCARKFKLERRSPRSYIENRNEINS